MRPENEIMQWLNQCGLPLSPDQAREALLHPGMADTQAQRLTFQRLEFLGDAAINFAAAQELMQRLPEASEGQLSLVRTHLVRTETLIEHATRIGLDRIAEIRPADRDSKGAPLGRILADLFEALVGTLVKTKGVEAARQWLAPMFETRLQALGDTPDIQDAKSELNEWAQRQRLPVPGYDTQADGAGFVSHVRCGTHEAMGTGTNKRRAEQDAAGKLLGLLSSIVPSTEPSAGASND